MSAVAVEHLWMGYNGVSVLENVNLAVTPGSFVTLVGASGCGKSTFLRLLLGAERPVRGKITVDDAPLPADPGPDRGIVFQRYSVFPHLTCLENVLVGLEFRAASWSARLFGAARRRGLERAAEMLAAVGLEGVEGAMPSALSGGMQQRLAIAQALVLEPHILLLDEPFGALDPGIRLDMHGLVTKLWREKGMTIFMVTHDISEAFKLGTRVLTFDKVRRDPQVPDAYGARITYDLPGYNRREV